MTGIACFVSHHGFGHAARASAVMAALRERMPGLRLDIYTRVPRWFFEQSLETGFSYHALETDIGMVQLNSLAEDINATVARLDKFLPFEDCLLDRLSTELAENGVRAVLADISPLGLAVARRAGLPSVLVENFTWDWIYRHFLKEAPALDRHIRFLSEINEKVVHHIQTEPFCDPVGASLTTPPVSRRYRRPRGDVRSLLGLKEESKVVLLTMGGVPWDYRFLSRLAGEGSTFFLIPGAADRLVRQGNLLLLPHHSSFFHPDLVGASDAVVGKAGYSTLAEVYHAGVPFGYVSRATFPEARALAAFIETNMPGLAISEGEFAEGSWIERLPEILSKPRTRSPEAGGAALIASYIADTLL